MKYLLAGLVSFFSIFGFYTQDNADFQLSKINYTEGNQIEMTLQIKDDNVMAVEQTLTYDSDAFELDEIETNKYFTLTQSEPTTEDGKTTVKLLFDSEYAFKSVEYANVYFNIKKSTGVITIDNIYSSDLNYNLNHSYGETYDLTIENDNLSVLKKELSIQNQLNEFGQENKTILIAIAVGILVLIVLKNIIQGIVNHNKKNKQPFAEVDDDITTLIEKHAVNQNQYFKDPNELSKTEIKQVEEIAAQEELKEIEKEEKEKEENEPISDDVFKGKYEVFILLLLVGSLLLTTTVMAKAEVKIQPIREAIVNSTYNSELDINSDKKINVVDLVYAIGTEDVENKGVINFKSQEVEETTTEEAIPTE